MLLFLNNASLRGFILKAVPVLETKRKLKDILIICSSAIPDGQERTLVLGELY